jgi:flagellar M-ring protein FliF
MWSLIKTGGIALGIALLVLVVWLRSRRNREEYEEFEDEETDFEPIQVESVRDPALDDRAHQQAVAQREKVRGEISEMVSDRPDEVATMLRGWFADAK